MSQPLSRTPSAVLVLGAIASVQIGSAVAAGLFRHIGSSGAVFLRLVSASLILLALWRPRLRHRTRRQIALAATFGVVLAAMNLSFYASLHRIPLGIAVTFEFIGPLLVAVSGSRRPLDLLWIVLAAVGIVALSHPGGGGHSLDTLGVLLAVLAGLFWGAYILLNAQIGRVFEGPTGLTLAMLVATLAALPFGVTAGGSRLLEPHSLLVGAGVGILSSAIPYTFENEALRRIAAPVFGVLMSLEPGMAALAGLVILGQGLSLRAAVGIGLVVAASVGASRRSAEAPIAV